jgi:hypothetical protein
MKKLIPLIIAVTLVSISAASAQTNFRTINSAEMNIYWLNAYELPSNGGGYWDGGPTQIDNLNAQYSSSSSVVFSPNTTNNPSPIWYTPSGEVGALGNKMINSFLLGQESGTLSGRLEFAGFVTSYNLLTNAAGIPYTLTALIKDFAPDYSSVVEKYEPITSTGSFAVSLDLIAEPGRNVQWGLLMVGPNIWPEDTAQLATAGSVIVVPEPTTYALLGLAAAGGLLARRFRRKA